LIVADHRCEFSGLAEGDLDDIALYIASHSPRAALRFVAELRRYCQELTNYPAKHRMREEYGAGVRVAVHRKYLIFYAERDGLVVIERTLHGSRHLDWVQL
jgi:toxin ParE1/3/4